MNSFETKPEDLSDRSLQLVILKAEEWNCTPREAVARILDQDAKASGIKGRKKEDATTAQPEGADLVPA